MALGCKWCGEKKWEEARNEEDLPMNQVEHACHKCNGLGFELRDSGISKENPYEPYYFSLTCTECKGRGGFEVEQTDEKEGMTAEELIEELQKVDPESLVQMEVEINGISCWIGCSSVRTLLQQKRAKCNFVILEGY